MIKSAIRTYFSFKGFYAALVEIAEGRLVGQNYPIPNTYREYLDATDSGRAYDHGNVDRIGLSLAINGATVSNALQPYYADASQKGTLP